MEWVEKISKVIAYGIVYLVKGIVYPIFYITKTIRIFFLIIEKWSYTLLESLSFKKQDQEIEKKEDDDLTLGVNFNANAYYKE